ncbi:MAG: hypothetical protein KGM43_18395 [Planctomycetota bacterium]|nr:hypothetical protein [Planctomycetota bacterium]
MTDDRVEATKPVGKLEPSLGKQLDRRTAAEGLARGWFEPRAAVLILLASVLGIGGGRKLWHAWQGRRLVEALSDPNVEPGLILDASKFGRTALIDLFRILGTAEDSTRRSAAGRALARLWALDEMIPEEEQALVRRGFEVTWGARRRYPRALAFPIPIEAEYGVPFLVADAPALPTVRLEWSHKVFGTERAGLESASGWTSMQGRASFTIEPADFPTNGPHRLALQASVRTVGLTSNWQIDLPRMPFTFEFDPLLHIDSLCALEDTERAATFQNLVRLQASNASGSMDSRFVEINAEYALRDPPEIVVETPLPCDLSHRIEVEFEGSARRFSVGTLVLSGQGWTQADSARVLQSFPLSPFQADATAVERTGTTRLRVILSADPALGWTEPNIRSIWPGTITTDWYEARVVRR